MREIEQLGPAPVDDLGMPDAVLSVIGELCLATFSGKGSEGYRLALARLREELQEAGT